MEYKAKYRLSKTQYIAEVNGSLAIVTTDKDGNIKRVVIFTKEEQR